MRFGSDGQRKTTAVTRLERMADAVRNEDDWTVHGVCRGQDQALWFPEPGQTVNTAKALCRQCPVIEECRDWALRFEDFGVWGGMSERERRRYRRTHGRYTRSSNKQAV